MKIAISTDGGEVSQHFGRCELYTIFNVEDGNVLEKEVIENPGHSPGFLPEFLSQKGIEVIISGGMGHKAKVLFSQKNIQCISGVTGSVDDVIVEFVNGKLKGGEDLCEHD